MPYIFSKCHTLRAVSPTPQVPPIPGHRGRTLAADVNPGSHAGSTGAWDEMQWKRYHYSWHRDRPCVAMDLIGAPITPPHDSARPGKAGSDQGGATLRGIDADRGARDGTGGPARWPRCSLWRRRRDGRMGSMKGLPYSPAVPAELYES